MCRTMLVNSYALRVNVLNLGNVKGASGAIADSHEFAFDKRLAVCGVILSGVRVSFRERSVVGQHVRSDALISPVSSVICDGIRSVAEAFDDGAWSFPGRDMLRTAAGLLHLLRCRRNRDFHFLANQKRFTTAVFV